MQVARAFTAVRPARPTVAPAIQAPQRVAVVVQVKPTKLADFTGLTNEELVVKSNTLKLEMAKVRFLQRTGGAIPKAGEAQPQRDPEQTPKGHLNKHIRRQIAQCLTVLRQRQIAEGIDARASKRITKKAALKAGVLQKSAKAKAL